MRARSLDDMIRRITEKIAKFENTPVEKLPPLGNAIDIDALEAVIQSCGDDAVVEFSYRNWNVRIRGDRQITMSEPTSERGPYESRCNTCGEVQDGVDLDTAQEFFATHADRRHEVEIVRNGGTITDRPTAAEETGSEEVAKTD